MSRTERYEEAAAYWGDLCCREIEFRSKNGITNYYVAIATAIKAASCAFIAHPEWRE